jgi:hypothetical protein
MALDSSSALIAAAREDAAGFDDRPRPGSLHGPPTTQQRDEQRASIEREQAAYEAEGNAGGVAACASELQRLATVPVAEPPVSEPGERRPDPSAERHKLAEGHGSIEGGVSTIAQGDYRQKVEAEREQYRKEGNAANVVTCDAELANIERTNQ